MESYLPLYIVIGYMLFILIMTIYYIFKIVKLLPDNVKYRYRITTRFKVAFLSSAYWKNEIDDKDLKYFIAFNKGNRTYNKIMIYAFIVFNVIFFSTIGYMYSSLIW